jgi:hypothetical protein
MIKLKKLLKLLIAFLKVFLVIKIMLIDYKKIVEYIKRENELLYDRENI